MRNPWRWRRALIYVLVLASLVGPSTFPDLAWGNAAWLFVVWEWGASRLDRLRDEELERGSLDTKAGS